MVTQFFDLDLKECAILLSPPISSDCPIEFESGRGCDIADSVFHHAQIYTFEGETVLTAFANSRRYEPFEPSS